MRKGGLEDVVMTGKIEGNRSRGRPRINYIKSLSEAINASAVDVLQRTRDRNAWRSMVADVQIGYGT